MSFITHGDPNVAKDPTSPVWPDFKEAEVNIAFALPADGGIHTESDYRKEQCDYWDTLAGGPC